MKLFGAGKNLRWSRLINHRTSRGLIVPVDHGLTYGPISGLGSINEIARCLSHPAITGTIAHKGMVARLANAGVLAGKGVMVHLNGMSSIAEAPDTKRMLTSIESAIRLGADAVSLQLNFTEDNSAHNLTLLGTVVDEAQRYCLPVLAMIYDKTQQENGKRIERIRHLMRIGYELGVDAVKTEAPESLMDVPALLDGLVQEMAIFFSGGTLKSDSQLLAVAQAVVDNGGAGLCIGRNVFQRKDPVPFLDQIAAVLNQDR
jgi:fructose-bisphosphate aldolase, class I